MEIDDAFVNRLCNLVIILAGVGLLTLISGVTLLAYSIIGWFL